MLATCQHFILRRPRSTVLTVHVISTDFEAPGPRPNRRRSCTPSHVLMPSYLLLWSLSHPCPLGRKLIVFDFKAMHVVLIMRCRLVRSWVAARRETAAFSPHRCSDTSGTSPGYKTCGSSRNARGKSRISAWPATFAMSRCKHVRHRACENANHTSKGRSLHIFCLWG